MNAEKGDRDSVIDAAHRWTNKHADELDLPPLKSGDGGGTFDGMEARVKRLEDDMKEVKGDLKSLLVNSAEIKTLLQSTASKADVESARSSLSDRVSGIEGQAKHMLTFWQFLIVVGGLLAIILRWPELFKLIGSTSGVQ